MHDQTPIQLEASTPIPEWPVAVSVLPRGVNCCKCRYELEGLLSTGSCPECATPIAHSLRSDALVFADPAYLRRLRVGAELATWGAFSWVGMSVLGWAVALVIAQGVPVEIARVIALMIHLGSGIVMLRGIWILTTPEEQRAGAERSGWLAPAARWILVGSFGVAELAIWIEFVPGGSGGAGAALLPSLIGCAIGWALLLRVVARIYHRCRVYRLANLARTGSGFLVACACVPILTVAITVSLPIVSNAVRVVLAFGVGLLPLFGIILFAATLVMAFIVMVELGAWISKARVRAEAIRVGGGIGGN